MKIVQRLSMMILTIFNIILPLGGIPPLTEPVQQTRIQLALESIVEEKGLPGLNLCLITDHGKSEIYSSG